MADGQGGRRRRTRSTRWTPGSWPGWTVPRAFGAAAVGVALLATFGWLLPPFDLEVFLRGARHVVGGAPLYPSLHSAEFRTGHGFVYPWVVAWAFVPLGLLAPGAAAAAYLAASVAGIGVACHLLGGRGPYPVAVVVASSVTVVGLQMGTLNAAFLLGLAVAWDRRDHPVTVGVVIGVVAVAKLFLLPLLVWLLLARRYRAAGVAAATVTVLLGAGWLWGPLGAGPYASLLAELGRIESPRSWSLVSLATSFDIGAGVAQALAAAVAGAAVVLGAAAARRRGDERILFVATLAAALLLSPIVWSSYLILLAVPLLVCARGPVPLAVAGALSWLLVTPDAASPDRVAFGAAVSAIVAVLVVRHAHPDVLRLRPLARRWSTGHTAGMVAAGAMVAAGLVSAQVRNALPAVVAVVVATAVAWSRPTVLRHPDL